MSGLVGEMFRARRPLVRIQLQRVLRPRAQLLPWLTALLFSLHWARAPVALGWAALVAALCLGSFLDPDLGADPDATSDTTWLVSRGVDRLQLLVAQAVAMALASALVVLLLAATLLLRGLPLSGGWLIQLGLVLLFLLIGAAERLAAGPPRSRSGAKAPWARWAVLVLVLALLPLVPLLPLRPPLWSVPLVGLPLLAWATSRAHEAWRDAEV